MEVRILILLLTVLGATQARRRKAKKSTLEVDIIKGHNAKRSGEPAKVMPSLKWDRNLAACAQKWANSCAFSHGQPAISKCQKGYIGQNLYASWGKDTTHIGTTATESWFSEKADYDLGANKCAKGKACGHYTQLVWAETTLVGCGYKHCSDGMDYVVCNYLKGGNVNNRPPYEKA